MKKELFIMIALLIATVFVISACNSGGEAASVKNALAANINANECSADDTCEMENAVIEGNLHVSNNANAYRVNSNTINTENLHVSTEEPNGQILTADPYGGVQVNTEAAFNDLATFNQPVEMSDGLLIDDGGLSVEGLILTQELKLISLSGQGNAYACLDHYGNLYRSETSCD